MDWWHTANLLAQNANINKAKHSPTVDPAKLNPFAKRAKPRQATPEEIAKLLGKDWQSVVTQ